MANLDNLITLADHTAQYAEITSVDPAMVGYGGLFATLRDLRIPRHRLNSLASR